MKNVLKRISKKTLSCILALAVILCSLTVVFSAFAADEPETVTEPYTVSYRSPAVPMFVGKAVALKDLEIDFSEADGDTYAGDKVIWSVVEGESAQILGGGFYAVKTGMTKFTAKYGELTQNVYVMVNEEGDTNFKLIDLDLTTNGTDYNANDWVMGGIAASAVSYPGGTKTTVASVNGYDATPLKINATDISQNVNGITANGGWSRSVLLYKSEILKDFADYTYTAGVYFPNYTDNQSDTELARTVTLITRANFNTEYTVETYDIVKEDQTAGTAQIPAADIFTSNVLGVQLSPYGGVGITNLNGNIGNKFDATNGWTGNETNYWPRWQYHNVALEKINYANDPENVTLDTNYVYRKTAGTDTISVKVDGSDLKVDLNNQYNILDTTAETIHMSDFLVTGRASKPSSYIESKGGNIITALADTTGAALRQKIAERATVGSGSIGIMTTYTSDIRLKTVTVSVNIDEMPNLTAPTFYTVKGASPAIPMFAGKVVALSDIAVEFGDALVSGNDVEWTQPADSVVLKIGDTLYATATGIAKFTAKYGELTQNVYVMVNEEGDYDFNLVDLDFQNDASDYTLDNWMYANNNVTYDQYYDGTARNVMNGTSYRNANNATDINNRMYLSQSGGVKALRVSGEYYGSMFLYNAPILKDFADYTITSNLRVDSLWGDGFPDFTTFARAQVNFNAPYSKPVSDTDTTVDTTVPTIFAGQGADGADGTALMLRHRAFGGLLIGTNNAGTYNLNGSTGVSSNGYHSLSNTTKIYGIIDTNSNLTEATADIKYVLAADGSYANHGGHIYTNARTSKLEYVLDGADIKYSLNDNVILDTKAQTIYRTNHTTRDGASAQTNVTDVYHEQFAQYGTTAAGNAIGFGGFASSAYIFDLKVKLNGITKDTMPKMSDPSFYTVTADNPVIPMTAATKLDTSSFLVEFGGGAVSGSALTWTTNADAAKLKIVDGVIYAYERGTYTATITDGTATDYIHFVVKNPDETEYVIYENDYREENEDVSDWKTVVMVTNASTNVTTEFTGKYNSQDGKYITGNVASKMYTYTFNPHAFVPYDPLDLGTTINQTNHITTYTTLDNDILADLSDYKVTAGMRMYPNYRGAVGIVGRVSDTVDGLYTVGTSTAVGIAAGSPGMYVYNHRYPTQKAFTIKGQSTYTALSNTDVNYYLSGSIQNGRNFEYRVFELEFSGNTATYTAPNGAIEQITGLGDTKGTVALFSESKDAVTSTYVSVPALADIRIVLNNTDVSGLEFESIDGHTPAATPVIESYIDKQNYTFTTHANGYFIDYVKTDDRSYSRKVVMPSEFEGKVYENWAQSVFSYTSSGTRKPERNELGEVVLAEGLQKSWGNAFRDNQNLQFFTFPVSYTEVAGGEFLGATALINAIFPEGSKLTAVGNQGFENCSSLSSVKLPEGLKTIGDSAFRNCKVLYDINIPSTVQTIGSKAFEAVPFKNVTLPAATSSLGDNAFANCTYLEKVYVLNASMTIGATAIPATATIYGYAGSTAEEYAATNGNTFVPIDDIASNEMAANTAFDLKQAKFTVGGTQVAGSDITWTAHRGADYEISNGWLLVYGEEDITVTGTSAAGDVSINIAVAPKGTETGLVVKTIADENMTVAPVEGDATAYTVTINETDAVALKYGTLTVTADNCGAVKVTNAADSTGTAFGFNVLKPETMELAAEYTTLAERETSIYPLGVQVRPKTDTYTAGVRFVTRVPEIKEQVGGIYLDEAYTQVGVLIIPEVLWTSATLPEAEELANAEVSMGNYDAQNVIIEKLMTANEAYADAAALLTNIPSSMYNIDIMAIPYLIGKDGNVTYVEDYMSKSYNDVLSAAYPVYNSADDVFYGGTDHDIDGIASTTSLSYETGEDITFSLNLKGAYVMKWQLDKDDPDVNAIDGENYTEGSTVVKSGTFDPAKDGSVFTLTTKMNQAGVVRLKVSFIDASDTTVATINMSAAVDYENITQSLEEGFTAEYLVNETKGYYDTWTAAWDTQVAAVNNAIAADEGLATWLDDTTKESGALYTVGDVLKLQVVTKGTDYTAYNFWIATDSSVGLGSSDVINNRPATGVFSVPNGAADGSLGMLVSYCAYGGESVGTGAPTSGKFDVRILNHGKDNNSTFDVSSSGMTGTDPADVYQYGILRRDYIAMQVAKTLFSSEYNGNIKTSGGSMGGWQAVACAALDEDVNEINTSITWMCQLGATTYGDIYSWHPEYTTDKTASRVFSTVTAARIINDRVKNGSDAFTLDISTAGLGDYDASAPHGVIALYNAFDGDNDNITKSATFYQFKSHGATVYGTYTNFVTVLTNK